MTKEECEIETSKAIMKMRNQIAELKAGKQEKQMAAAGEREREKRLKNNQISLLCKYGLTEKDAQELAAEYGLLSPIYNYAKRGGCFFCPNATIKEIKYLYKNNF